MANKATKGQVKKRVYETVELILKGYDPSYISRYASENWGITTRRQAERYIHRANKAIKGMVQRDEQNIYERTKKRHDFLLTKAIEKGDYHLYRATLADMRKLYGLDKPEKHAITDSDGNDIALDEAKREAISRLGRIVAAIGSNGHTGSNGEVAEA